MGQGRYQVRDSQRIQVRGSPKDSGPNGPLHLQCPALQYPGKCNEYNIDLDTTFTVASAPALILQHSINRSLWYTHDLWIKCVIAFIHAVAL